MEQPTRVQVNDPGYYMSAPKRRIGCSVASNVEYRMLAGALRAHGVDPDTVKAVQGEEGVDIIDRSGEEHGMLANLKRFFPMMNNHVLANMGAIEEVLEAGGYAISIPAEDEDTANELADIFRAHGAQNILWFGKDEMIKYNPLPADAPN